MAAGGSCKARGRDIEVEQRRRGGNLKVKSRRRRKKAQILAVFIFVCAVLVLGITNLVLNRYVSKFPEDVIADNVFVGATDVSGMSKDEARAVLEARLEEDKAVAVSVQVGEQRAEGTLAEYGLAYKDLGRTVDKAMGYGKEGSLWSRFWKLRRLGKKKAVLGEDLILSKEAGAEILAERAAPLARRAKSATLVQGEEGFSIEKEEEGEIVNISESLKRIQSYLNDGWNHTAVNVGAVIDAEKPAVTAEDLEGIEDQLGYFATDAGSGERLQNLRNGVEKMSHFILMPGEEVSVEERTKPYTAENGYVLGDSYEAGKVVQTYGGGLCQVSTTLYNAVLYAELEVVERYPHSMMVSYVTPSRDAAVAEGIKDFIFKNNYDSPIYIAGGIDEANQLYFAIYGKDTRDEGWTVEYESEVLATQDPETTYKSDRDMDFGFIQEVESAHTGTEAQLWKVMYQNGEEVGREVVNYSLYNKTDRVMAVGTNSDNAEAVAIVERAVAEQDLSAIYAAIAEAQALE